MVMPSKSKKQQDFMAAVANNPKFAKKAGVPQSVGKDYEKADKMKGMKKYQAGGMSQGYNARLDDSMGAKNGKKKQSMKSRRDESEGMEESMGKRKFAGDKAMKFQAGGPMPVGMANPRAGVTGGMRQQELIDPETGLPPKEGGMPMGGVNPERVEMQTGSMPPRRINDPTPAQQRQAMRQARSAARRGGGGRKAGGKIGAYKAGGKVRGAGCATKGTRAAKMVTMKGS
jgi:hypothetical protein